MLAILLTLALAGEGTPTVRERATPAPPPSSRAEALLQRNECHRCHAVEGVAAYPTEKSCAGCHRDISTSPTDPERMKRGHAEYGDAWPRFIERTGNHYVFVPSLTSMNRLRASWLRNFLAAPYDVRPHLSESMIRHALTTDDVDTLVTAWHATPDLDTPRPPPERLRDGATLYESKGCGTCHVFGSRPALPVHRERQPRVETLALAPDLRHARDRMNRDVLVRWIREPAAVKPDTKMPAPGVTVDEASLLADFLLFADPGTTTKSPRRPPPFDSEAPVPAFEEVQAKVFRAVCWHCHSDPDFNDGDGGPGNTGGFGLRGAGVSFASWDSIARGALGPDGKRRSIFRPGTSGEPVLLERLRRRFEENDRDFVHPGTVADRRPGADGPRGMPLGLPALSDEQFSLVERWVKGGHPGPRRAPLP